MKKITTAIPPTFICSILFLALLVSCSEDNGTKKVIEEISECVDTIEEWNETFQNASGTWFAFVNNAAFSMKDPEIDTSNNQVILTFRDGENQPQVYVLDASLSSCTSMIGLNWTSVGNNETIRFLIEPTVTEISLRYNSVALTLKTINDAYVSSVEDFLQKFVTQADELWELDTLIRCEDTIAIATEYPNLNLSIDYADISNDSVIFELNVSDDNDPASAKKNGGLIFGDPVNNPLAIRLFTMDIDLFQSEGTNITGTLQTSSSLGSEIDFIVEDLISENMTIDLGDVEECPTGGRIARHRNSSSSYTKIFAE